MSDAAQGAGRIPPGGTVGILGGGQLARGAGPGGRPLGVASAALRRRRRRAARRQGHTGVSDSQLMAGQAVLLQTAARTARRPAAVEHEERMLQLSLHRHLRGTQ